MVEGDICTSGISQNHTIANTTAKRSDNAYVTSYYDCDNSNSNKGWSFDSKSYYVIDAKKAVCGAGANYNYGGRYGAVDWLAYKSTTCSAGQACNPNLDEQVVADRNGTIPSPCSSTSDIWISEDDLTMSKQNGDVNFTLTIHSFNISASNVNVTFKGVKDGAVVRSDDKIINVISSQTSYTASVAFPLDFDYINVYIDSNNVIKNEIETNNFISIRALAKIDAYLSVSTGLSLVDAEITAYLEKHVNSVPEANANLIIAVGNPFMNTKVNEYNDYTWNNFKWKYDKSFRRINYNAALYYKPYNAIAGSFYTGGKTRIFVYGNEIDGTVAAVKRLVSKKTYFFNNLEKEKSVLLDDAEAYAASSFMHTTANLQDYNKNNNNFASIANKVLNDQTYEQLIYYVEEPGANTQLRIKHVNPIVGSDLIAASGENPVVLSQQIWRLRT